MVLGYLVSKSSRGDSTSSKLSPKQGSGPQDTKFAETQRAAEQGDASAQYKLGLLYAFVENERKAVEWFLKAAEQNDANAQVLLGFMYDMGKGIIRDRQEACRLWRAAAEQGNEQAIDNYNNDCAK
jgi:TPR repeat protein